MDLVRAIRYTDCLEECSNTERMALMMRGAEAQIGVRVRVRIKDQGEHEGAIKYIGELKNKRGCYFGIELKVWPFVVVLS